MATLRPEDLESPTITGTDSTVTKDIKVVISNTTTYISDADALKFQSANNIRLDAISVRTSAGSIVWVDPAYPEIVKLYQNGTYTGDINEVPSEGVIAIMYSTTEFKTYNTDVPLPPPSTSIDKTTIKTFGGGLIPILPPPPEDIPTTGSNGGTGGSGGIIPILPPPTDIPTGGIVPIIPPPLPYTPLPVDPVYVPNTIYITVTLRIIPSDIHFDPDPVVYPWTLDINAIPLPLHAAIMAAVRQILNGKIENYFDQDRVGKTLLNFGQDYQALLLNWQYDTTDIVNTEETGGTVLVKLYQPLPPEVGVRTEAWISRELSPSYIDQIFVVFVPSQGIRVYLRPPNRSLSVQLVDGLELNNVTQQTLFSTGSTSPTNLTDPVLEQWYTTALEGAELNVDYTDFTQFVFYSSAAKRLEAFRQKMLILEEYDTILAEQSASIASATSASLVAGFTSSLAYSGYQRVSEQRMDMIRSFDGYERFLYYDSGSAYSSSFTSDGAPDDQLYYLYNATWPKVNGTNISVASASNASLYSIGVNELYFDPAGDYSGLVSWWDAINFIASDYDRQNSNRLVNNLPEYLSTDTQSEEFLTFVDMIGHHFDVVKVYADHMPQIYDRDNDPNVGMSPDVVWNVAASFGINLPNQYAIKHLMDYTIGDTSTLDPVVYREMAAETWKRFLHNQIYLLKTKGTKAALRGLMNVYGVLPTTIQIRESGTPSLEVSQSYELIEEQTNVLPFVSGTHVKIPFSSSVETVQVRFATTVATQSVLFNVSGSWGVRLLPTSSSYGRVALVNQAGTNVASSSVFEIYGGDYYTVTVQRAGSSASLWTQRADESGEIVDSSIVSASLGTWYSGSFLSLGMSGSTWGTSFSGTIDEVRVWSETLSTNTINRHVQYAGLYNGNTSTSARDSLLVRLSFNIPRNLYATASLPNESPYINVSGRSAVYTAFTASGFANDTTYPYSMEVVTRNVLRYAPNTGASQFVSNKIIVEDPPVLRYVANDSGSSIPVLSHDKSMVTVWEKPDDVLSNNTIGFYFSPTDAINDSIIRSIGNFDLQSYIGDPSDLYAANYPDLKTLNELYWSSYAYEYNYNSFVDFVQDLLQPMFTQAQTMVPARSKLITGIVLESPILERNKIQWNPIDTSGYGTFEEDVTPTFYPDAITSEPTTVSGDFLLTEANFEEVQENPIDATFDLFESTLDLSVTDVIYSDMPTYLGEIDMLSQTSSPNLIGTDFLVVDSITEQQDYYNNLLASFGVTDVMQLTSSQLATFNQLMAAYQPAANVLVQTGMDPNMDTNLYTAAIEPYTDFLQVAVTNYFLQSQGVFLIPIQRTVRVGQSTLTDRGTWTRQTTYRRNDYVIQLGATGSAEIGNGREYVCITPLSTNIFVSYIEPSVDTYNWKRVQYTTVPDNSVRKATEISGSIQLVDPASAYPAFVGYNSKHYKNYRDVRLGTRRHNWIGCVQTDDTTFDGRPAVEVLASAGDILVVTDGAEPIQRTNAQSGPRLDVQ